MGESVQAAATVLHTCLVSKDFFFCQNRVQLGILEFLVPCSSSPLALEPYGPWC
jgi:hypothetical protein